MEKENCVPNWSPTKYKNVHEWIEVINGEAFLFVKTVLDECESPIEELFAIGLCHELGLASSKAADNYKNGQYGIHPQKTFEVDGSNYRVDFCIDKMSELKRKEYLYTRIAVECDGYEYHSSKEQIAYDHRRDTGLLLRHGLHVIRFTGAELNDNPLECARTAIAILDQIHSSGLRNIELGKKLAKESNGIKRNKGVEADE